MKVLWCVLWAAIVVTGNDEVVLKNPGITQFWTDDYKVFDQIYGRTSDKSLYGGTLPPSISYGVDTIKPQLTLKNKYKLEDATAAGSQIDAYGLGDNFAHLHQRVKNAKDFFKPVKNSNLLYNFNKPISEETDPEAFDYLKHLEQLGKQEVVEFPQKAIAEFQPQSGNFRQVGIESYKSIQDILDAKQKEEEEDVKYVNYPVRNKKQNVRLIQNNKLNQSRCGGKSQGRCRKRSNYNYSRHGYRPRSRPVVRTIKHTVVSD